MYAMTIHCKVLCPPCRCFRQSKYKPRSGLDRFAIVGFELQLADGAIGEGNDGEHMVPFGIHKTDSIWAIASRSFADFHIVAAIRARTTPSRTYCRAFIAILSSIAIIPTANGVPASSETKGSIPGTSLFPSIEFS